METPPELQAAVGRTEDVTITNREYDDESVIAVDFGPAAGEPELDVVAETAIVVVDNIQFEFDVPPDATDVVVNGGILTLTSSPR
ncbi:DUF7127 family protein [Natrarchaeobius chitinivorans]|uniref:Hsp20/alpha crystallin family protein n=1 Tax=Natrarchaeobius chitinivorans TaxID=1679083 RepID=A0A3N6LVQ6_NATCH|nr:hypothetical protein [Natrarchaeobius chitinivorans]RQG94568.1 hypothetical protein EA473_10795 [Natrarchaeobius chitinivorans]